MAKIAELNDVDTELPVAGAILPVRVEASLLKDLWDADSGPQSSEGLVAANQRVLCAMAAEKLQRGTFEHGLIVLREADLRS